MNAQLAACQVMARRSSRYAVFLPSMVAKHKHSMSKSRARSNDQPYVNVRNNCGKCALRHAALSVHGFLCTGAIQMCDHGHVWCTQATTFLVIVKVPAYRWLNQEVCGLWLTWWVARPRTACMAPGPPRLPTDRLTPATNPHSIMSSFSRQCAEWHSLSKRSLLCSMFLCKLHNSAHRPGCSNTTTKTGTAYAPTSEWYIL